MRPRTCRDLAADRRGAIVVVGTFMAIFLTAGLFFILGTGEAILYRERVQDAADAIAFSGAGVHARGMNLIVLINMVMAAILAVLVALKMLQAMTTILTAVACVICAVPFGQWACGFCSAGTSFAPRLQTAIDKYEKVVEKVLPLMSRLQRVVAWTTPYVALMKSQTVAEKYAPIVTAGGVISPSMVPCVPGPCNGGKIGLPVQEDEYANLCAKAGEYVTDVAFFWMGGPLSILKAGLEKFAGWLTGSFPGYFCGAGGVHAGGATTSIENIAKKACQEMEKGKKQEHEDQHGNLDDFHFDMQECEDDKKQEFQGEVDDTLGQGTAGTFSGQLSAEMTHKKVYDGARHGGFYFQVFGLANADAKWPRRNDRGVLIASQAGGLAVPTNLFTAMRFAQAEFFFDKPGSWNDNQDQAMWELAWRARLRRVRPMAPNAAGFSFTQATSKFMDLLGPQITQELMDADVFEFLIGQSVFDGAESWLEGQAAKLGGQLDSKLDSKLQIQSWEMVH